MNHNITAARLLADLDEAIEVLGQAGETQWQAWLRLGREEIAAGDRHGPGLVLSAFTGDQSGPFEDLRRTGPLSEERYEELRQSIIVGCTELQIFQFRYNSLRIESPVDDRGDEWTPELIHQRLVEGEYEGLDLYPGFPLTLRFSPQSDSCDS